MHRRTVDKPAKQKAKNPNQTTRQEAETPRRTVRTIIKIVDTTTGQNPTTKSRKSPIFSQIDMDTSMVPTSAKLWLASSGPPT